MPPALLGGHLRTLLRSSKLIGMRNAFSEIELRRFDLNLLLVFSALMRERSVSRAAGRLYLGPSAVSMALGRLREVVGDPLLVRAGAVMEPTPRALALWAVVEPSLATLEAALHEVRNFDPARSEAVLRFAAPDDLEFVLVPRLLERLGNDAANVRLVVRPSDFRTVLDRLDTGDADLALGATPERGLERRHRVRSLMQEGFSVLFDPAQVGAEPPLDLDTYAATPHVLLSPAGDLTGALDGALAAVGRTRTVLAAVSHFPTIPFVLKRRRALANVPSTAAAHFARAYDLAICPPPLMVPQFEVSLAWHARADADPAHAWFRNMVAEEVQLLSLDAEKPV